jgi:hypothetical protein
VVGSQTSRTLPRHAGQRAEPAGDRDVTAVFIAEPFRLSCARPAG